MRTLLFTALCSGVFASGSAVGRNATPRADTSTSSWLNPFRRSPVSPAAIPAPNSGKASFLPVPPSSSNDVEIDSGDALDAFSFPPTRVSLFKPKPGTLMTEEDEDDWTSPGDDLEAKLEAANEKRNKLLQKRQNCAGSPLPTTRACPCAEQTFCAQGFRGSCAFLDTDNDNCGACFNRCGGGLTCRDGVCGCNTAGLTGCNGRCVNLQTDTRNCGRCGNFCPLGNVCRNGVCRRRTINNGG